MTSPRQSQVGSTSGGTFSNFLPRFRRDSTASPQQAAGPTVGLPLSPPRFAAAGTEPGPANASEGRRLSVSRGRSRELSPSPTTSSSQTISPRTSLTNLSAHARQQGMAFSSSSSADQAAKSTVSPPKLTLTTTGDGESGRAAQAIIIPSPSDVTSHPASPFTLGREDEARTPTAETGGRLGERDLRVGSGSLTLEDVPSGVAHHNGPHFQPEMDTRASSSRPTSPRKHASASFASSANGGESSQRASHYSSYDGASEPASLTAPSTGHSLTPDPSNDSPDGKKARRKRGLSASSFTRRAKPAANGIAGALAGISKDLINPTTGLSLVRSRTAEDGSHQVSGRPRGDTGESVRSTGSGKKAVKKDKRRSTASSREGEVFENGISRTRASSISFMSSNGGDSPASSAEFADGNSPALSHRALVAALGDTDVRSDYGGDGRSAYSGGGDEDDSRSMLDESEDDLDGLPDDGDDYDIDDLPVTGFAVASVKRNADFHALFETAVPEDDYLIEDYGCALQREILLQGRLYVSENHICFHANIFGWVTNLVLPFSEMVRIDKKMTALIIPNAIQISTLHAKHTFASFLSRDTTYDVIHNIWRLSHPHLPPGKGAPSDESGSRRQSNAGETSADEIGRSASPSVGGGAKDPAAARRQPTTCSCLRKGEHYPEIAMDAVFPSSPEKIYNLIFTSGFSKDFMINDQMLMDLQVSDWKPQDASSSDMLVRSMSYIKPLAGGFGPKQTKCELKDETAHVDFDDYVSMLTTTRTPDVPSGGAFSVKTRTCLMWAGANSTRVLVTTKVEWTGRSFIKGIIESSALAGQKEFHGALEQAMRLYIAAHLTEFHLEGVEDDVDDASHMTGTGAPGSPAPGAGGGGVSLGDHDADQAKKKAEQEGLVFQYGIDNIGKGAIEMLKGGWAIVESACGMLSLHGALALVIGVLVVSNLWTLLSLRGSQTTATRAGRAAGRSPRAPPPVPRRVGTRESPDSVADAVKSFLEEYMQQVNDPQDRSAPLDEVAALSATLDALEARIGRLRAQLPAPTRAPDLPPDQALPGLPDLNAID